MMSRWRLWAGIGEWILFARWFAWGQRTLACRAGFGSATRALWYHPPA